MIKWLVLYDVAAIAYVFTVDAGSSFSDAATVEDHIRDVLRRGGKTPEMLLVFGPYDGVVTDGIPFQNDAAG